EIFSPLYVHNDAPVEDRGKKVFVPQDPAHAGTGLKAQSLKKTGEQSVQLKTVAAPASQNHFVVEICNSQRNRTVIFIDVQVFKRDPALVGENQSIQVGLVQNRPGSGSQPFQIEFRIGNGFI